MNKRGRQEAVGPRKKDAEAKLGKIKGEIREGEHFKVKALPEPKGRTRLLSA